MLSEDNTGDSELFDTLSPETSSDDGANADDQTTESESNTPSEIKLDEPKKFTAQEQAAKQVDVIAERVMSGELSIDEIAQPWLKKRVKSQLENADSASMNEQALDKLLDKRDNVKRYAELRKDLNANRWSKEQQKTIGSEYKDLIDMGVPTAKALAKAMKMAGNPIEDNVNATRKSNAALPVAGDAQEPELEITDDNFHGMSSEDRVNAFEKIRARGGSRHKV